MTTTYCNEIEQIAQQVFSTMVGIDLVCGETGSELTDDCLTSMVDITGAWTGSVSLKLTPQTVLQSAAAMFQMPPEEIVQDDKEDVVSELVNMVGGNLKTLLPGPSKLSLPRIVNDDDYASEINGLSSINEIVLRCETGMIQVCLYSKKAA